jgi:hypothetical protein
MSSDNFFLLSAKTIFQSLWKIAYFPLWWYTQGFLNILKKFGKFLLMREKSLALFLWIKNIHKPMYAQTDWQGRLISLFMRLVQIIARSIIMIVYLILVLIGIFVWLASPVFVTYEIIFQTF